jgi:hypothetical protein
MMLTGNAVFYTLRCSRPMRDVGSGFSPKP